MRMGAGRVIAACLAVLLVGLGFLLWRQSSGGGGLGSEGWSVTRALPSPTGSDVAFLGTPRQGDVLRTRLVLAGADPAELSPSGVQARSFAWLPDGESLLLAYSDDVGSEHPTRFAVIGTDGSVVRRLEPDRQGIVESGIAIEPDGQRALLPAREMSPYIGPTDLWRLDLSTGAVEVVSSEDTDGEAQAWPTFVSQDEVVLASGKPISATEGANGWIGRLDLETDSVERLTDEAMTADFPSITPGGEYVVFEAFPGNERSKRGLWYAPIDGSAAPKLLIERLPGRAAALEADGRSVLVVDAGAPGDASKIWRLGVPEGAPWIAG